MEAAVFSLLALLSLLIPANSSPPAKSRTLYEIACTMCSTCCNPAPASPPPPPLSPPSPSPPPPSPPSPSPPPPSSGAYCPPPPSHSNYYPPPSTYPYSSPPPPQGGGGGYYNYPPPDYNKYPAPPPPNPIVPYFPFYFHTPPPASMSGSLKIGGGVGRRIGFPAIVILLFLV